MQNICRHLLTAHHLEALPKLSCRLEKPRKQLKKSLGLGASYRTFESRLPDAIKSHSPANISTATQEGGVLPASTCVQIECNTNSRSGMLHTTFSGIPDKERTADNPSTTDCAQAFLTRLRTNLIQCFAPLLSCCHHIRRPMPGLALRQPSLHPTPVLSSKWLAQP